MQYISLHTMLSSVRKCRPSTHVCHPYNCSGGTGRWLQSLGYSIPSAGCVSRPTASDVCSHHKRCGKQSLLSCIICCRHHLLFGGDLDGELERDEVPDELLDMLDLEDREGLELTLRLRPRAGLRGAGDLDLEEEGERGRRRAGEGERLRAPAPLSGPPLLGGVRRRAGERGRGEGLLPGLGRLPADPATPRGGLRDRLQGIGTTTPSGPEEP
jgi:hypothetical protein